MSVAGVLLLNIINFVFGIIGLLLGLRIVLKLFSASASAPIVTWLYSITDGLISPFVGIFPGIALGTSGTVDVVAIIALIAYSIVFYIIAGVIRSTLHTASIGTEEHVVHEHA